MRLRQLSYRNKILALALLSVCHVCLPGRLPAQTVEGEIPFNRITRDKQYDTAGISRLIARGEAILDKTPNSDEALTVLRQALQHSIAAGYVDGAAAALYLTGRCYKEKGMYDAGIAAFIEGLRYSRKAKDRNITGKIYNGLGTCYFLKTDYKQTTFYFYKAVAEVKAHRLTDPYYIAMLYSNFGLLWLHLDDSIQAFSYLKSGEEVANTARQYKILTNVYSNLGYYYYQYGKDLVKSNKYHFAALKVARQHHDMRSEQVAIHNIGSILMDQGQTEKAIPYFRKALGLKTNSDPYTSIIGEYYALGVAYYTLKDYGNAEKNVLSALEKARGTGLKYYIARCYELLYLIHSEEGNYREAFRNARNYIDIQDSILNEDKSRSIREMEAKYRSSEKDKVIMRKQLQISRQESNLRQKNIWIAWISGGSLLAIILLAALYRINYHKRNLQQKQIHILEQEQELLRQGQEIERLKATMQGEEKERTRIARELHDGIGGMLVAIRMNLGVVRKEYYEITDTGKLDDIIQMVNDTSSEVRKTAHNLMPDILTRHNLAEALVIYCEHVNTPDELELELQFHGNIDQLSKDVELILYRIVQELIQNIIKHANATYAVIQVVQHEEKLSIFVEDNGTGFAVDDAHGGYGLENLRFRIMTLQGDLAIASEKGKNTTVYIEFDLEKLKNNIMV